MPRHAPATQPTRFARRMHPRSTNTSSSTSSSTSSASSSTSSSPCRVSRAEDSDNKFEDTMQAAHASWPHDPLAEVASSAAFYDTGETPECTPCAYVVHSQRILHRVKAQENANPVVKARLQAATKSASKFFTR